MENKPFERIQRSFNYTPESIFTNQWSNLAFGVGMIIIPALFPFGLRIRHLRILSPAVFSTILILGGVLLLFFTWRSMRNARALKAAGGKITVDGTRVTYPEVEKGKVEYRSFLTTDIEYVKDVQGQDAGQLHHLRDSLFRLRGGVRSLPRTSGIIT